MNFQKFPKCILARVKNINRLSSSMLDEVAPTQSSNVYVAFIKISFCMVLGSWRKICIRCSLRRGWRS